MPADDVDPDQLGATAASEGSSPAPAPKGKHRSALKELPVLLGTALVLSFVVQTFLARVFTIPSESMEPTLLGCDACGITNDRIVVDKVSYRFGEPRPGDVVVFKGPSSWPRETTTVASDNALVRGLQQLGSVVGLASPDESDFVKRVIATGGQTVMCCDAQGNVVLDGRSLTEPYVVNDFAFVPGQQDCTSPRVSGRCFAAATVPKGDLWVMGDNRNHSGDSRVHGAVPVGNVIGKVRVVVLPVSRWRTVSSPEIDPPTAAGSAPS